MKKIFWMFLPLILVATLALGGSSDYWGETGATKTIHVDNVARSFQTLYTNAGGTWAYTDTAGKVRSPNGVFITCETLATRWGFGGTTPTTSLGHVFTQDSSWHLAGENYVLTGKGIASGATDNVTCQMTPEY